MNSETALPPSPVQPQPLLRIFADPVFDHRGDRLRGALDVDLAVLVAHRLHFLGQFGPEAVAGQADDAHAMDWAFDLTEEARQHRIGPGLAAEEGDLDAAGQI